MAHGSTSTDAGRGHVCIHYTASDNSQRATYVNGDFYWAYFYALNVIKGRWPEGEEFIIENPFFAYIYACNVIKGRWPEAEQTIKKDMFWYYEYILHVAAKYDKVDDSLLKQALENRE